MAVADRTYFSLAKLTAVLQPLAELESPCILIGGQAVYCWAEKLLPLEPALQRFAVLTTFVSKDIDFQGSVQSARDLGRKLKRPVEVPGLREAFGNLLSGKIFLEVGGHCLNIEILRKVPGFEVKNPLRFAIEERRGESKFLVLDPVGMLQAKAWNVVNIHKEGRRDTEQFIIMVACVRAYLRLLLQLAREGQVPLRGFLSTMERVFAFSEGPEGRSTAEACGLRWELILPMAELETAAEPELVALREKRLPRWRSKIERQKPATPASPLHQKMLAILAETVRPAPPNRPLPTPNRKSE